MRAAKPYQPSLFDQPAEEKKPAIVFDMARGKKLAEIGLDLAVENAGRKEKDWKKKCWQLFLLWLRRKKRYQDEFMIEEFRSYLQDYDLMEMPPSQRAFGFVSVKAAKEGWIIHAGMGKVKNVKAHRANANKWVRA